VVGLGEMLMRKGNGWDGRGQYPRRRITVAVVLSVAPGVTKAQALKEVRSRINDQCCYFLDGEDVKVRSAT
jgi:hypothetical protein